MKPILVVIDIQKEYVTEGRPYFINGIGPSLEKAKSVMATARAAGWELVHIRHLQKGEIFSPESPYSGFVAGFEPAKGESEIVKGDYSCYSAPEFARLMKDSIE